MIELLDYILDYNNNFWIIYHITKEGYYGYIVYEQNDNGDRYNNITSLNYIKRNGNELIKIPEYKMLFKPRECFKNHYNEIPDIWKKYIESLQNIGIDDIGIFGSYLIGFDPNKDIDFVIYGLENFKKYYNNQDYIKKYINASNITKEHIEHQYNKHKKYYPKECDLKKIISRNWSGVELDSGVLSTPRFVIDNYISPIKDGIDEINIVEIIDDTYTDFLPRRAKAKLNNEIFEIITPLWKYQSFARNKDKIEIYGNYNYKEKTIILDDMKYYMKYIN